MMRASLVQARERIEFETADLVDLSWTPWRRIMLSARENIWALVDAEDFPWLSENVWNVSWGKSCPWKKYAKRNVGPDRATLRMHREIMIRNDPRSDRFMSTHHVDHGNGNGLDNRWRDRPGCPGNLSWATPKQNAANRFQRADIPSLDSIVLQLLAELGPRPEIVEVPF